MRVTLRWLADFVDIPTDDPKAVADRLESLGHEVESIEPLGAHFTDVVVGRVTEIAAHPDADKVRVCQVDVGGSTSEIICGAWNFEAGALVPVAVPGAVLPGGFEITERTIRGVTSHGMICSGAELGLSDDSEGILVLDDSFEIGRSFAEQLPLPDAVFDVAITPNRPDCMSVYGLARELAASYDLPLREVAPDIDTETEAPLTVRLEDPEGCPRYVARQVNGVTTAESPLWLQMRLRAAGVRPISNLVDATNYVLMELGHPTHAFDTDRLGDTIVVRRPTPEERMTTLDGQERALAESDLVIADAQRSIALAGLMGGADTEVDDSTSAVTIEAAYFDAPTVLFMSKRIGLRSEASARFERGVDPNLARLAADRVAELLVSIAGGEVGGIVDAYPAPIEPRHIDLELAEIPRVLGLDLEAAVIADYLRRLGFAVEAGSSLDVGVPTRRPDVTRPIDLVEEIARLHGYDEFPDRVAFGTGGGIGIEERRSRRLRETLVGAGFHEAMTFSFIGEDDLNRLGLPADDVRRDGIAVVNPLHAEEGVMRTTLLPGLLKAAAYNAARQVDDIA
ncbi:MAG: phenylalanine--tRNA ligase subunit beta, partial [Acidimicrobiia bacterium]|nr:phenylalanine--tRNA ligase subunit beta [Acidimicrobiia bacterium]